MRVRADGTSSLAEAVTLRSLGEGDAAAYADFFRGGVRAHVDTLRISEADLDSAPFSTAETAETVTFLAFDTEGRWLGVGTLDRDGGRTKRRHIAWIVRMYVAASASGKGVGRLLLRALLDRAKTLPGIEKISLTVAAENPGAIALYTSEGFVEHGREEDAFRDPRPRTELTMSLRLSAT